MLLLRAVQTGLRVSELIGLNCGDVTLGTGASVRCEARAANNERSARRSGRGNAASLAGRAGRPLIACDYSEVQSPVPHCGNVLAGLLGIVAVSP